MSNATPLTVTFVIIYEEEYAGGFTTTFKNQIKPKFEEYKEGFTNILKAKTNCK